MPLKPPSARIWALFRKLETLAQRGVDGEKAVAARKLARLQARYDFTGPVSGEARDLFSGKFARASAAQPIYSFKANELDLASSVKWAIESATKIHCVHRGTDLLAQATPATARKLREICGHITERFRVLLERFRCLTGATPADRSSFVMGLYDGMMNDVRTAGQRLPGRYAGRSKRKPKNQPANASACMHVHPYSIAVSLGKQIRFAAPLEQIAAELEAVAPKWLAQDRP